jgi:hypothetical protein
VSDIEHELVQETERLRERLRQLTAVARRALATAIAAQDRASGRHDPWLDEELAALEELAPRV